MKKVFRHITHFFSVLLLLHLLTINVQAQATDDYDDILDGHPEAAFFEQDNDITPDIVMLLLRDLHDNNQQINHNHHPKQRARIFSYITLDINKMEDALPKFCIFNSNTNHYPARNTQYDYLFFEEINPPPPKGC